LKADEIRAHHSLDEPRTCRKGEEDLRVRKRDVEEESDARIGQPLPKERRNAHELIVVHPDDVTRPVVRGHSVRIARVDGLIDVPTLDAQRHAVDSVVTDRPEHAVRDTLVEHLDLVRVELQGDGAKLLEAAKHVGPRDRVETVERTRPSDPEPIGALVRDAQSRRDTADAPVHDWLTMLDAYGDGKPIRDDDEARGAHAVIDGDVASCKARWLVRSIACELVMRRQRR
jgi:hypothetical protein